MNGSNSDHYFALRKGAKLHNFEIQAVLGHGGFGITYEAFDQDLQQTVAIKEYLPNDLAVRTTDNSVHAKSGDSKHSFETGVKTFIEEARLLARFRHPNIVHVRRYFELHGTGYIVTEFIAGESLSARLSRGAVDGRETLGILTGILNGLEVLHDAAILHRDLKPSNVMIREDGTAVLIDFGAARDFTGRHSRSVTAIATSGYSPPEQYGIGGQQGPWTDLYALGAIAYRCVSGAPPVDSLRRLRNDPLIPASDAYKGQYDTSLLAAIDQLLKINESERPSCVADVRRLLAIAPSTAVAKKVPIRGNAMLAWSTAACVGLTLAIGSAWYHWRVVPQRLEAEKKTMQQLADARFDRETLIRLAAACAGKCPEVIRSEIGRRISVIDGEQTAYGTAQDDVEGLRNYTKKCEACLMREAATRRANELEAEKTAREEAATRAAQAAAKRRAELGFWDRAKDANSPQLFEQYLQGYPDGTFADIARMNLQRLRAVASEADTVVLTDPQLLTEIKERLYELNYDPDDGNDASLRQAIIDFESHNQLPQVGKPTQKLLTELRAAQPLRPWGAIVYARNANKWGISWSNISRRQAVASARSSCGDSQCTFEVSFFGNSCGALGSGEGAWAIASRRTVDEAKQAVTSECREKHKECQITAVVCAGGGSRFSAGN